jgi:hypothetical protein
MISLETKDNMNLCLDSNGLGQIIFTDETPMHVTIMKSGWLDLFHVIVENGELMSADHSLIDSNKFKERFGFSVSLSDIL